MNQIPVRSVPNGPLALCGYPPVCNRGVTEPTPRMIEDILLVGKRLLHRDLVAGVRRVGHPDHPDRSQMLGNLGIMYWRDVAWYVRHG